MNKRCLALAAYVAQCGAVRVHRDRLSGLSVDLGVSPRDLMRSIDGLRLAGQVLVDGPELVLLPPAKGVAAS